MSKLLKQLTGISLTGGPEIATAGEILICLMAAALMAAVMMGVYRLCHDTLTYQKKFNITLMMLALASAVLLVLIRNNPMFSLGALGALSICRIRTNTRDPRDLGFVFWSLSIGISCAMGSYLIGAIGTVVMSAVMLLIGRNPRKKDVLTMVVRGEKRRIEQAQAILSRMPGSSIQSKNVFPDSFELVYTLKGAPEEEEQLLTIFNNMEGIHGVNVLAPQTQVV